MSFITGKFWAFKELMYFSNWPSLLLGRLPIFNSRYAVYQKDSINFITDYQGGDAVGARHLLARGIYTEFLDKINVSDGTIRTVLDLGANNGGFILCLLQRISKPLTKIVAVEFNYRTYLRLHYNVLYNINPETSTKLINGAAAGKDGWIQSEDHCGSVGNSIYSTSNTTSTIKVPAITFDTLYNENFLNEQIDLCKIDIESAEYEVLSAESSQNLSKVRYLIIEIHPGKDRSPQSLVDIIINRGFELLIAGNSISPEVYLFKNVQKI